MLLSAGTRLGPYEIIAAIGAGGMGEVYRAKDKRLDRTVAIKVMPSQLSGKAELKQRFDREARAISNLSHPHICTLHDIGHHDGIDYVVMEFIEGQTLAERLSKGALPTAQALQIGIQIGDALDKAHKKGIIHRDLKPGNIMITKPGL
jgi:eukaryotic-like serine/threonine-protein kinase